MSCTPPQKKCPLQHFAVVHVVARLLISVTGHQPQLGINLLKRPPARRPGLDSVGAGFSEMRLN